LELLQVCEGFGEVGDELIFLSGIDNHIVYISLDFFSRSATSSTFVPPFDMSLQHF
jgi:hypothetical protein